MSYRAIVGASAGLLLAITSVAITSAGSSREAGTPASAGGGYSSGGGGGANEHGAGGTSIGHGGEDHSTGLGDGRSFGGGGVRSFEGTGSRGASSASGGDRIMHAPWHVDKPSGGLHSPRIPPGEVGRGAFDGGDRVAHSNGALPSRRSEPSAKSMHQNATVHEQALAGNAHRFVRRHFAGRVGEHNQLPARYGRGEGAIGWVGGAFWPDAFYDLLEYAFGPYDADYPGDQRSDPDEVGAQACGREAAGALDLPFDWIHRTLHLSDDQQAKLEDLKIAVHRAVHALEASCRTPPEPTAVGRLDTIERRLTAMLNAVNMVRGPLATLYGSLSDEQRVRFDHMPMPRSRTAASLATHPESRGALPPGPPREW